MDGYRTRILSGITIGSNDIIHAGAEVTKDDEDYTVVSGYFQEKNNRKMIRG